MPHYTYSFLDLDRNQTFDWEYGVDVRVMCWSVDSFSDGEQTSVDDSSEFKAMVEELCKLEGQIPPFCKFQEIVCCSSLSQNCSSCNNAIVMAGLSVQMDPLLAVGKHPSCANVPLGKGSEKKKTRFYLELSPKLWVGGGQES